jgi:hypothetical protein
LITVFALQPNANAGVAHVGLGWQQSEAVHVAVVHRSWGSGLLITSVALQPLARNGLPASSHVLCSSQHSTCVQVANAQVTASGLALRE